MFAQTFGHNLLRKYVIYFGTIFNNVWLNRYDLNDALVQRSKVPINYGPRDKFLARTEGNPDLQRPIAIQLPRMTFELIGFEYDPTRRQNSLNKITVPAENGLKYQYSPVPYNLTFQLSIMAKNILDGTYIVEQIIPYFGPMWQATLNINPDLGLKYDVPVILNNVEQEDTYTGYFTERRAIIWTLTFTMKAWFFGPTVQTGGIIKNMDVNLIAPQGVSAQDATANTFGSKLNINITPGVDLSNNAVNSSYYTYTYQLNNKVGDFFVTERVENSQDFNNFAYVKFANTSHIVTLQPQTATIEAGDRIRGLISNATANVVSVTIDPLVKPWANTQPGDDYGFIYDLTEYL